MRYPAANGHDHIGVFGDTEFCDECGFPASDHRLPESEVIKRWVSPTGKELGQIEMRKRDRFWSFSIRQWNGNEWHPLTVGYQSGLFTCAHDHFESWKRVQEVLFSMREV